MDMTIYQAADRLYGNAKGKGNGLWWPTDLLEKNPGLELCVEQKIATKKKEKTPEVKYTVYKMTDEALKIMDEQKPIEDALKRLYDDILQGGKGIRLPIGSVDSALEWCVDSEFAAKTTETTQEGESTVYLMTCQGAQDYQIGNLFMKIGLVPIGNPTIKPLTE